jgi:hypothetical protein
MGMNFQTDTGKRVAVKTEDIQALSFIDQDVFLMYTAGDCDVFLPYVDIR